MSRQENWSVGRAVPEDAEIMAHMHAESFIDTYHSPTDDEYNLRVVAYAEQYLSPRRINMRAALIAASLPSHDGDDDQLYLHAKTNRDTSLGLLYGIRTERRQEIGSLYVAKDRKRQGIGRALVERFIEWSDPKRPVQLGVAIDNFNAQAFYARLGFKEIPGTERDFIPIKGLREITMMREGDER